jgi:hypothetical protein
MENQEKENFTRLLKLNDIGIKHFIDCLIVTELTKLKFPLIDVGTGPGFPGIPLKILYPSERIILAEGVQRRVEFLKDVLLKESFIKGQYSTAFLSETYGEGFKLAPLTDEQKKYAEKSHRSQSGSSSSTESLKYVSPWRISP